ncbi:MAG: NBR1-Ig-like domain-containing protein [Anaerolineae bacterium]
MTIPDGMEMAPGEEFNKIWTIRNTGTCPWSELIALTQVGGEALGLVQSVPLYDAAPGEEQNILVTMKAPEEEGTYRSEWRACYEGECFGTLLSAQIRVIEPTREAMQGYIDLINDTGMGAYIAVVEYDGDPSSIKITVRNSWHYEPKQIRLQAAQLLWDAWAKGFCPDSNLDYCRIKLVDLAENDVGGSSWLAGSIIRVPD